MPALLSGGSEHYNRARRIPQNDPVAQLNYYLMSSSDSTLDSSPISSSPRHTNPRNASSTNGRNPGQEMDFGSALYARHLRRAIREQRQAPFQLPEEVSVSQPRRSRRREGPISPAGSSGFSEGTREEPSRAELIARPSFQVQLGDSAVHLKKTQGQWRPQQQQQEKSHHVAIFAPEEFSAGAATVPAVRRKAAPRCSRMKRRNIKRFNRRLLMGDDQGHHLADPYALSELFSQSEIPGFREIFASDSYLRKFCWIVAFLFMTVWSLNDISELISEYYEYPVTVDVRLRDSARLPFPSVTVCNLNVVRYSALCTNPDGRFNLTGQIPNELREKLCGLQVDKKNASAGETDIGDINNIGIGTTTPQPTTTSTGAPPATAGATTPTGQLDGSLSDSAGGATTPAEHRGNGSAAASSTTTTRPPTPAPTPDEFADPSSLLMGAAAARGRHLNRAESGAGRSVREKTARRSRRSIRVESEGRDERPFASSSSRVRVWLGPRVSPSPLAGGGQPERRLPAATGLNTRINLAPNTNVERPGLGSPVNPKHGFLGPTPATSTQSPSSGSSSSPPSFVPAALPEDFELTERQERELQENLTNWLAVMYNRDPALTSWLGHQFDDMLLRCTMKSTNCTHKRSFDASFTPTEGNCFTYRSKFRRRTLGGKTSGSGGQLYEEANLASTSHGLELVLNLEKSEYISGSSQVGALVMVHHPSDLGYAASEATFVAPEFTTYIGVKMVNLTRLPSPYPEHCVDSWPAKFADRLTRNSTYSQQACIRICLQKTIQSHCSCQSAFLPIVELEVSGPQQSPTNASSQVNQSQSEAQRIIICDTRKLAIRQCVRDVMLRSADRVHNCECPPKCQVVRYEKTISMARWPTREDKVTFDRGKMDLNFQNLAKVIVYFQTMTCDEVTQQAVFNAAKLFSALGGIMGMYVGFSFLSVFEIFEVMSRKMWHHFKMRLAEATTCLSRGDQ